jgi:hypothetical protein
MTAAYFEDHPTDPDKVILRKPRLDQGPDYERGFIDGMQYQRRSSVDKAVNAMTVRTHTPEDVQKIMEPWVGLTEEERKESWNVGGKKDQALRAVLIQTIRAIEAKLKEKNS